mgnify:CR=1 FL=1
MTEKPQNPPIKVKMKIGEIEIDRLGEPIGWGSSQDELAPQIAAPLDAYALEIRFRDDGFATSTKRQEFFYFWLAVVVIVMMLLGAFFLVTMIARWSRLHRLRKIHTVQICCAAFSRCRKPGQTP